MPVRHDRLAVDDVRDALTGAALSVVALRVSIHGESDAPASTVAADLEVPMAAWSEVLRGANAPALPLPRDADTFTLMGDVQPLAQPAAPQPLAPQSLGELEALARRQGEALAQWVADGLDAASERMQVVRDAYRDVVDAVRRARQWLRSRTEESAARVRSFLDAWIEHARERLGYFNRWVGRAVSGLGVALGLGLGLWALGSGRS